MRPTFLSAGVALALAAPAPALAQSADWSAHIADQGLAATAGAIEALEAPDQADLFALGGVRFLGAIERGLQTRWRANLVDADELGLPLLRLPIPENPQPDPFTPAIVPDLFRALIDDLAASREALARMGDAEFALRIRLDQLWFDINGNGQRDPGEGVLDVAGVLVLGQPPPPKVTIQFDLADSAWLSAYTHLLTGMSQLILAFDPETAIARVLEAGDQFRSFQGAATSTGELDRMFGSIFDRAMMLWLALTGQTDAELTRAARESLLSMVADNRRFWALLEAETDNVDEWIPNERQTAALGFSLVPGTGAAWQEVLDDFEGLLTGRLLIPHWRMGDGAGINLRRLLEDPGPVDPVAWVHGVGLLPWVETGELATPEALWRFDTVTQGNGILFALLFN